MWPLEARVSQRSAAMIPFFHVFAFITHNDLFLSLCDQVFALTRSSLNFLSARCLSSFSPRLLDFTVSSRSVVNSVRAALPIMCELICNSLQLSCFVLLRSGGTVYRVSMYGDLSTIQESDVWRTPFHVFESFCHSYRSYHRTCRRY